MRGAGRLRAVMPLTEECNNIHAISRSLRHTWRRADVRWRIASPFSKRGTGGGSVKEITNLLGYVKFPTNPGRTQFFSSMTQKMFYPLMENVFLTVFQIKN